MKNLTSNAQTQIDQLTGTEPFLFVEIEWSEGSIVRYGDKSIAELFEGKLLAVGQIESILTLDNKQTDSVDITLDDIDSSINLIINTKNVHKAPCRVYQYYGALNNLSDAILIFSGQISSPFIWGEDDRSITFTVTSEIESFEVGFSPEEGQLDFVSQDFIGNPWPLVFGQCAHVPATKVHQALTGQLSIRIGIVDPVLYWQLNRFAAQYVEAAFLLDFYKKLMAGADYISRPVADIISDFMQIIKEERQIGVQILAVRDQAEVDRTRLHDNPAHFPKNWEETLDKSILAELAPLSDIANVIAIRKNKIIRDDNTAGTIPTRGEIPLAELEYQTKTQAAEGQIKQYNIMLQLYAEYVAVEQEICRQSKNVRTSFKVIGGERFPQGEIIDIFIKNMGFRGTFADDVFTVIAGPFAKYTNLPVAQWVMDDDACAPTDETNGVSVFYLDGQTPPSNLLDCWLLVKKKGDADNQRHVIRLIRQDGRKLIFELREWGGSQGQPSGVSLDELVGKVVDIPIIPTSIFGGIPGDLYTGNVDPDLYQRPEVAYLATLINDLSQYGGINHEEFEALAKLVFLLPLDELSNSVLFTSPTARDVFTIIGEDVESITEVAGSVMQTWLDTYSIPWQELPETLEWTADAGSDVRESADDCQIYIANILPSTIHAVQAYKTESLSGFRSLQPIPSSYYIKKENSNLGSINVTALVFPIALTNIAGENWEPEVYVTLTSSIGPRITDIIQHLIETYTIDGSIDATSFTAIDTHFDDRYPANFFLIERPNVLDEIARIAFESRCAIYRRGNIFYLKYLSLEPNEDITFDLSHIKNQSLKITYTTTEELVTRLIAYWKPDGLPLQQYQLPYKQVYRNNVRKYGVHTREELFHIYNQPELVKKSATFWLIRWSNTWKQLDFQMFLRDLPVDVLDTILFDVDKEFYASENVKGIVRSIVHDPNSNMLSTQVWLPVRAGEMTTYPFAWPAALPEETVFPDLQEGLGGGYGPGLNVKGTIDGC